MVEGFEHRRRLDECARDHGPRCALDNALWQPDLENDGSGFWHSYSIPISLAHHTLAGDGCTTALLLRFALSLRTELKGSAVAVEHPRRGRRGNDMGRLCAAVSTL